MSTTTATIEPATVDPIDQLVPPSRPKWVRLLAAIAIVTVVGTFGYVWRFGVIRPAPECCGSSSGWVPIGPSGQDGAVTVVVTFFNSSPRSIDVDSASADLTGATVVDIAPFPDENGFSLPPTRLRAFPVTVAAQDELHLAVTFTPDRCDGFRSSDGWGEVQLDLAVGGDPWYPTLGRTSGIPILPPGPNEVTVLAPDGFDDVVFDTTNPLSMACVLLGS